MDEEEAVHHVWNYHHTKHNLAPADGIMCLCSSDIRVAQHAAQLHLQGYGAWVLFSGGFGTGPHSGKNLLGWTDPEAVVFAREAEKCASYVPCRVEYDQFFAENQGGKQKHHCVL